MVGTEAEMAVARAAVVGVADSAPEMVAMGTLVGDSAGGAGRAVAMARAIRAKEEGERVVVGTVGVMVREVAVVAAVAVGPREAVKEAAMAALAVAAMAPAAPARAEVAEQVKRVSSVGTVGTAVALLGSVVKVEEAKAAAMVVAARAAVLREVPTVVPTAE